MGRRKRVSDGRVLECALTVLADGGRADFTLARVALEAGMAAPTLLQRFGSRDALLVAAQAYANAWIKQWLEGNPELDVPALLATLSEGFGSRRRFADHLSFLRDAPAGPEAEGLARERVAMIRAAVAARLPGRPPERVLTAELIEAQWHGAVLQWAIRPQRRLSTHVEVSLRAFMARIAA